MMGDQAVFFVADDYLHICIIMLVLFFLIDLVVTGDCKLVQING